ncbi:MAG: hypothetical protein IPG96_08650 [Proteobacteria bacterium]|nr:hypothetical protein [Pseudomonadota bacterium]
MRARNVIVAVLCLGVLGACGDDKGGVSSSAKVSELTPAQWTSWCEENAGTFAKDVQRASCTIAGLAAKQAGQGSCEAVRDQCSAKDTDDGIDCKSAPVARDGGRDQLQRDRGRAAEVLRRSDGRDRRCSPV